ncbi:MAG: hypothetical protein QXH75_03980 [Sulfolobaceae archaeon]
MFERILEHSGVKEYIKWARQNATVLIFSKLCVKNTYEFSETLFHEYNVFINSGECFEMQSYVRIGLGVIILNI